MGTIVSIENLMLYRLVLIIAGATSQLLLLLLVLLRREVVMLDDAGFLLRLHVVLQSGLEDRRTQVLCDTFAAASGYGVLVISQPHATARASAERRWWDIRLHSEMNKIPIFTDSYLLYI